MPVTTVTATDSPPSAVLSLHDRIRDALRDTLDDQWDEVMNHWEEGESSQKRAVRAYVSGLRNRMLSGLLEIDAMDELNRAIAIQYIEMKCHWTMLNTRIQNQTSRDGQARGNLMYRATCVSLIIQALEPLLSQERVDNLTTFLAEPFD